MQCTHCGTDFFDKKHPDRRFCSLRCSGLATARKCGHEPSVERPCGQCGKLFRSMPSAERLFCSTQCADLGRVKHRPKCDVCGNPVRLMRNRYCSKSCSNAARPRPGGASFAGFYQRAQKAHPEPKPCAVCGRPGQHRHHHDYSKPEDITWLCILCHRREHQLGRSWKRGEYKARPAKVPLFK